MIKKFTRFLLFLFSGITGATAQDFQMTIKTGSLPNSVRAVVKPGTAVDGQLSSAQITFIVPTTVGTRPNISIVNNFVSGMSYALFESTETLSDGTYYVWEFDGTGSAAVPNINYIGGNEYELLEVKFENGDPVTAQVRVAQLPNGGTGGTSPGNYNFYLALSGNDVVNQAAQFYGDVFSNDGNGYAGYSYAAITGIALPVKFLSFTANEKDGNGLLNWSVGNESALTDYYQVERSLNGTDFTSIQRIGASLNGQSSNQYNYIDPGVSVYNTDVIYYRIKQVDRDGKFVYSETRFIKTRKDLASVSVYPNPVVNITTAEVNLSAAAAIQINITDIQGKTLQTKLVTGVKGINRIPVSMSALPSGTYYLNLFTNAGKITVPVIKRNK